MIVYFTSAQVALIFLLCGFLLLSLTSVILCPCVLWFTRFFFCRWEICCIGAGAQTLHQKKYLFFVKYLHCEIFTLVCGFTLKIGCGTMTYCLRHSLLSDSICSPVLGVNILPFYSYLKQGRLGRMTLVLLWFCITSRASYLTSHFKNGSSFSHILSWSTWECLHWKQASSTDLY